MGKYEQPPSKEENKAGRTTKRERAAEREKREKARDEQRRQTTSGMMHPTMDYHRLLLQPGIIPQRIDLGWVGGGGGVH